ncbi:MAG: transglycosylase SLT domain-containing protein [Actinobacteria bacterium]|nr:transglycosylase SLT domain-containing protein [Actinomycetota bacterium]
MRLFRTLDRTKIAALIVTAFILLSPAAYASPLDSKRSELKSIDAQIKVNKSKQASAERRQADIRGQIEESSQKLVQMQTRLNALQTELNELIERTKATETKLDDTKKKLGEAETRLSDARTGLSLRRGAFDKRLVNTYKRGTENTLTILLKSEDFGDFMSRLAFLRMIAEHGGRLVLDLKQLTTDISGEVTQVRTMKKVIDEQHRRLVADKKRMDEKMASVIAQQERLETEVGKQQQLYAQIEEEQRQLAQAEDNLRSSSVKIAARIRALGGAASATSNAANIPKDLRPLAAATAEKYDIPEKLFFALITQESGWDYGAVSRSGALGLTQVMPFNVIAMGYDIESFKESPSDQLEAGARYLSRQFKTFDRWDLALAAYNAGPGAVLRYGGIPPYQETKNYVRAILASAG